MIVRGAIGPSIPASHRTEERFDSFLSGGFTTIVAMNSSQRKLAKRTSVQRIVLKIGGFHGIIGYVNEEVPKIG